MAPLKVGFNSIVLNTSLLNYQHDLLNIYLRMSSIAVFLLQEIALRVE
jgi:hypothetical protein